MLGGRRTGVVVRELLRPRNYSALLRMPRVYPEWRESMARYFAGRGGYPWRCRVRTPLGIVAPTLYSMHDMLTLNEVFCRLDYGDQRSVTTVVDLGSNIGISALFFLTRNPHARVWLYEPVPRNVERLQVNLAGFESRYALQGVAVAAEAGTASFGVERTGRYGGIGVQTGETIDVECVAISDVLEEVIASSSAVDILKIDTEGSELELLRAIEPDLLRRVRSVYLEAGARPDDLPPGFDSSFHNETLVLRNRSALNR